jgi:hypothetical protein
MLTKTQISFIKKQQIPLDRLFDASNKSRSLYSKEMKRIEAWIAYGVTPCKKGGHTLRVRSGHCIQCRPANISYFRRHYSQAEIYVAHSTRGRVVKVGTSINAADRISQLNYYQYGGRSDWTLKFKLFVTNSGHIESKVHRQLRDYSAEGWYFKDDVYVTCRETFSCSANKAISAIKAAID